LTSDSISMDEQQTASTGAGTPLCGKSWTAYTGSALLAALLFFGLLPLAFRWNQQAAAAVMALSTLTVGYRVLLIRSVRLYYDDIGVWLYSGILPWRAGVVGINWRDMDQASYVRGLWGWLSKSYTIRVGHRYTQSSGILLTGMARGDEAVARLNARHQELIRSHALV
jgi:hypothetical protein